MRRVALLLLCSCSAEVEHGLDEASANRVLLALERAGIAAEKETDPAADGLFVVSVPSRKVGEALEVLRADGLPRSPEAGLESFEDPGWIPTVAEERARYERAVAGELARSIETLEGVLDARVHVTVPVREPFVPPEAPRPRPRASVLIHVDGAGPPPPEDDVRALVVGAVEGIAAADVHVVVTRRAAAQGPRPRSPRSGVGAAWLGAASLLIAALALALLFSVAHSRSLARHIRAQRSKGQAE